MEQSAGLEFVLFDLMDEYTGLCVDQLIKHPKSKVVVAGRYTLPDAIFDACEKVAKKDQNARAIAENAAKVWSEHIVLPKELEKNGRDCYILPLFNLIYGQKLLFYESLQEQGAVFDLTSDTLVDQDKWGTQAYPGRNFDDTTTPLKGQLTNLLQQARSAQGEKRDAVLREIQELLRQQKATGMSGKARKAVDDSIGFVQEYIGSRTPIAKGMASYPKALANELNEQPVEGTTESSLIIIIGESEFRIAKLARQIINQTFQRRRETSYLEPTITFIFDEADVFIGGTAKSEAEMGGDSANVKEEATLLARRGRKFGLGLGIATQRATYLDTSIMAQPHTYFISKLPRKSDRERVAEAFAISDVTLEQTFDFTVGQWLVTSHDATGMKDDPVSCCSKKCER